MPSGPPPSDIALVGAEMSSVPEPSGETAASCHVPELYGKALNRPSPPNPAGTIAIAPTEELNPSGERAVSLSGTVEPGRSWPTWFMLYREKKSTPPGP
jgi:hypothetical protein